MIDKPPPRRKEFDEITMGWGSDPAADLGARLELVREYQGKAGPLTPAEIKVVSAMLKRVVALGEMVRV